jgi:hypothetical protein
VVPRGARLGLTAAATDRTGRCGTAARAVA